MGRRRPRGMEETVWMEGYEGRRREIEGVEGNGGDEGAGGDGRGNGER